MFNQTLDTIGGAIKTNKEKIILSFLFTTNVDSPNIINMNKYYLRDMTDLTNHFSMPYIEFLKCTM